MCHDLRRHMMCDTGMQGQRVVLHAGVFKFLRWLRGKEGGYWGDARLKSQLAQLKTLQEKVPPPCPSLCLHLPVPVPAPVSALRM